MPAIQFNKAVLIFICLLFISASNGKRNYTKLDLLLIGNSNLKKELRSKEIKREMLEDELSYHDSICQKKNH